MYWKIKKAKREYPEIMEIVIARSYNYHQQIGWQIKEVIVTKTEMLGAGTHRPKTQIFEEVTLPNWCCISEGSGWGWFCQC